MARIIQKPLKMKDDVSVRTYPELVENFDLEKVFCYLKNGELERWLRSRQQEEKAKAINELNVSDEKVEKKICKILLPSDRVAFVQEELNDILDSSVQKIYLYGTEFTIPVDKENITYIGLNRPVINVDSEKILDWKKANFQIENCEFGSRYEKLLKDSKKRQSKSLEAAKKYYNDMRIQKPYYVKHSYEELEEIARRRFELYQQALKIQKEEKSDGKNYYEKVAENNPSELIHSYEELEAIAKTRLEKYAMVLK